MNSGKKAKSRKVDAPSVARDNSSLEDCRRLRKGMEAKGSDELRSQKIRKIKKQIEEGTYHVDAAAVAKAIVRSETARLLSRKRR